MSPLDNSPKRIAFAIGALTKGELLAGNRDVSRVYSLLTNPELGNCSNNSPKPYHECGTRDEFQKALDNVLDNWQGEDQLVVYFTGHGKIVSGRYCLQVGSTGNNLLPFENLLNDLTIKGVHRAILILDTCYSGAATKIKTSEVLPLLDERQLPKGIVIIASSRASEVSLELRDGSSSVFTHLFCLGLETGLEGRKTPDGNITVQDIIDFVNHKLQSDDKYAGFFQRSVYGVTGADRSIWISKNRSGIYPKDSDAISKNAITSLEELQFLYDTTASSKHPCPSASIQDLDWDLVKQFARIIYPHLSEDHSREETLSSLKFYSPIPFQGQQVLHKSAVLCFAQRPDLFYEQAKSVFVVGNPGDTNFIREDVTGPLSRQVAILYEKVKERLASVSYIADDGYRRDRLEIDLEVVRELISNAVTHRNYDINGTVTVSLTEDALEIRSPGVFPPGTSWLVFLSSDKPASYPINVAISHYLANLLTFEGIGRGFDIFKQYLKHNGGSSITCSELPGSITLVRVLRRIPQAQGEILKPGVVENGDLVGGDVHIHQYLPVSKPLQRPPRVPYFVNREKELKQLLHDLQPGRVITICGPGGIGKTALATEVVWTLAPDNELPSQFPDGIVFHSFYNQPEVSLALENIIIAFGEDPKPTIMIAAQRALAGKRALLVLDGTEETDDLASVLAITGSCGVLITSRSRKDASGPRQDLSPLSMFESRKLLKSWAGNSVVDEAAAKRICELVDGLPLAVRLVGRYLAETGETAVEYLKWLEETPLAALDYENRLESILLERSLSQVSALAKRVLGVAGVLTFSSFSLEPVAAALNMSVNELRKPLGELTNYSLLLRRDERYEVGHALIHTYARTRLAVSSEVTKSLADYYIGFTEMESKKGLEGYYQLDNERAHILRVLTRCLELSDWERVQNLVWTIESYLDIRGYITDLLTVLGMGVVAADKTHNRHGEGVLLSRVGLAYSNLGQVEKAIENYEQALLIAREIGDQRSESSHLGSLGLAYSDLGQVERAIEYYEQSLMLAREINDRRGEGVGMANLGTAYRALGEVERAVDYFQQALVIAREIGDRRNEGAWLGNLGNAYRDLGQLEKAIEHYQMALAIASEVGDRRGEETNLGNLGNVYNAMGQVDEAIANYQQAIVIAREIGDRRNEGAWLGNLGNACRDVKQLEKAIEYYQQALTIAHEIGDRRGEGNRLGYLGNIYVSLGQMDTAIAYFEQAISIRREIGDRRGESEDLGNLGNAYYSLEQVDKAIACYEQALTLTREISDRYSEGLCLSNLGLTYSTLGEATQAITYYEQALVAAREVGDRRNEEIWLSKLESIYRSQKRDGTIVHFEQAHAVTGETDDQYEEVAEQENLPEQPKDKGLINRIFRRGHALIIGVGADLPATINDSQGIAAILKDEVRGAYPSSQVHLLTGLSATRDAILDALDILAQSSEKDSTIIVYFSGHGYQVSTSVSDAYFLLPYGYEVHRLKQTAISGAEFTAKLRAIPAQKVLVLLDCCHAGGVGDAKAPGLEFAKSPLPPETLELLAEGKGRVLIASSKEDELSYSGKPYSAFTLALIESLSGVGVAKQDGFVRVADVALHAREVVPGRTKGKQHPVLHFEHADNFALAYYSGGDTKPKGLPFDVEPEIEPEPGAWQGINQPAQIVHGPQTNIAGKVTGPVLSGQFDGPVAVGGGEAVDMRGSQGAVYKPSGPVKQHFGDRITITGDGNVIGNNNRVNVNKSQTTGVTVDEFLRLLGELREAIPQAGLDPDEEEAIVSDLQVAESLARKPKPNARLILSRITNAAGLLATADGALGMLQRLQPLAQQLQTWAGSLFR